MFGRVNNFLFPERAATMRERRDFSTSSSGGDCGNFTAFDSEKGKRLLDTHIRDITNAPEIYMPEGRQYVLMAGGDLVLPRTCGFPGRETDCLPVASIILRNKERLRNPSIQRRQK
jgi:hypothetical protein